MTFRKFILWFGVIGSIASILSLLFIFIPLEKNINLLVSTNSIEKLTQNFENEEPNLKVSYRYKGLEIQNLWKYNIVFQNTSNKTLIGKGNQKNILGENLTFNLKEGYQILDSRLLRKDFNNKIKVDTTSLKLFFEQWREEEILEYSFYVKTSTNKPDTVFLKQPDFRQIIDGDIIFIQDILNNKQSKITQFLPPKIRLVGYIITLVFLGIFIIGATAIIIFIPIAYVKIKLWKSKYFKEYSEIINKVFDDDEEKRNKLLKDPSLAPDFFWEKFNGAKFPNISMETEKIYPILFSLIFIIILDISFLISAVEIIRLI